MSRRGAGFARGKRGAPEPGFVHPSGEPLSVKSGTFPVRERSQGPGWVTPEGGGGTGWRYACVCV